MNPIDKNENLYYNRIDHTIGNIKPGGERGGLTNKP